MKDSSWPKKGDKAFSFPGDGAYFHMPSTLSLLPAHARAFKAAAEIIVEKCDADGDCPSNDILIFPVMYLYRHAIEVQLKSIIRVGVGTQFFEQADVSEDLKWHNLARLWTHAKKLLAHRWADPAPLNSVTSVINELHQSDPNGQVFRYDSDKDGRRHRYEKLPDRISPAQLAATIDGVLSFLDATCSGLETNLSDMLGAERDNGT